VEELRKADLTLEAVEAKLVDLDIYRDNLEVHYPPFQSV